MIINKIFDTFSKNFEKFKKKTEIEREKTLNRIIRRYSSFIPSLKEEELYLEIRKKIIDVFKDIKFRCFQCEQSCCIFDEDIYYSEEFGIYKEDFELAKANNLDTDGFTTQKNKDQMVYLKDFLKQIYRDNPVLLRIIDNLKIERISEINQTLKYSFGINYTLKLLRKDNLIYCYYYDLEKRKCKIYSNKPLLCLTYPLRILNNLTQVGTSVNDDCKYMIKMFNKLGMIKSKSFLFTLKSYWEYQILVFLFFIKKGRFKYDEEQRKYLQYIDFSYEDLMKMLLKE
jgi:Fe-S-cluster containining protein